MNKSTMETKQFVCMMALFFLGSTIATGGVRTAGRDSWLTFLFAGVACIPMLLMCARIANLYPGKTIHEIFELALGKVWGRALSMVFILFCLQLAALEFHDFSAFTTVAVLEHTPKLALLIPLGLLCGWMASAGLRAMGRMAALLFALTASAFVALQLLSLSLLHYENLLPILRQPAREIALNSARAMAYPFGESFLMLGVVCGLSGQRSSRRPILGGLLIGIVFLTTVALRNIAILGEFSYMHLYFPSYTSISLIQVSQYLQRIEPIVSTTMLCCVFVNISVCVYGAAEGVCHVFGAKRRTPVALALSMAAAVVSPLLFQNSRDLFDFTAYVYWLYALPVEFGLPLVTWIAAEVKRRKRTMATGNG